MYLSVLIVSSLLLLFYIYVFMPSSQDESPYNFRSQFIIQLCAQMLVQIAIQLHIN